MSSARPSWDPSSSQLRPMSLETTRKSQGGCAPLCVDWDHSDADYDDPASHTAPPRGSHTHTAADTHTEHPNPPICLKHTAVHIDRAATHRSSGTQIQVTSRSPLAVCLPVNHGCAFRPSLTWTLSFFQQWQESRGCSVL